MAAEQGLPAVLDALRRRWPLALLAALPLVLGVSAYPAPAPAAYDAETTVAFAPRPGAPIGADVLRVVLPRYVALLGAPATEQRVAAETGLPRELLEAAEVSVAPETANLTVVVRAPDPALAAAAANALAGAALADVADDELLTAQQVAPALPPDEPAAPPRTLLQLAGLLAGLLTGLAVAVVAERGRPLLRDTQDVAVAGRLPVLGQVPTGAGLTGEVPDPVLAPAVRAVVARAERAAGPAGARLLAVTSPTAGDGKTTLALAYATSAARRGCTVVLVDADLAGAGLTEALGGLGPREADLGAVLAGRARLRDGLAAGPVDGLRVLRSRPCPADVDLLTRRLPGLLEELLRGADQVVVDAPSLADDDGQVLLAQLPAALLVVRAGTPSAALTDSADLLDGLGVRTLGVVLNHPGGLPVNGRVPLVGEV